MSKKLNAKGPIAWMAQNPVAANLLMIILILTGLFSVRSIKQEIFPEFDLDTVTVSVPYPGASPEEVEQGIILAVEEKVRGLDGVKRVSSVSSESVGTVTIELQLGAKKDKVVNDVKNEVDRITSFPQEAEKPLVKVISPKQEVVSLIISGEEDLKTLHDLAEKARADLLNTKKVTQVEISGIRPLEVSIEVSQQTLQAYGLTLDQIAQQVRASAVQLPGGGIKTESGEILVRVNDRKLSQTAFESIIIRATATGQEIRLGDIATIVDGYAETDNSAFFNGKPAVSIDAYRVGKETPTAVAKAVKDYLKVFRRQVPDTIEMTIWDDDSLLLRERIDLLTRNAFFGLILVIVILSLFIKRQLAGWVALGIPISFLGAFLILGPLDVSINMITLFALIITLGMVVDDAIIVGENVYSKIDDGMEPLEAAVKGAGEMATPVTFSILTTVAAFSPLLFVPGIMGKIFFLIPVVVISVLMFSLIESFYILPAHLGHSSKKSRVLDTLFFPVDYLEARVSRGLKRFISGPYEKVLQYVLYWRYAAFAVALIILMISVNLVRTGIIPFSFFPKIDGDVVRTTVMLPFGSSVDETIKVSKKVEQALNKTIQKFGGDDIILGIFTKIGEGGSLGMGPRGGAASTGSHILSMEVNLLSSEKRSFSASAFAKSWQNSLPALPGIDSLTIKSSTGPSAGKAVDIQITHSDIEVLQRASVFLEQELYNYKVLTNIENSFTSGKPQMDFSIRSGANAYGLTSFDIARAIRASFFGSEVLREQRGRNEVKVMVRLPEEQRKSELDIDNLLIPTRTGGYVPLAYVTDLERGISPTSIVRESGQRVINVSAELQAGVRSSREVLTQIKDDIFPVLKKDFPGLSFSLEGEQREQRESFQTLGMNFILAMFIIFTLLAIPLRSYIQPVIVMVAIPFGFVGAVIGHLIMGFTISIISMMGIIALAGIVVNDSLLLVDSTNKNREKGQALKESVLSGAKSRFRPVLLTSLTTFFGMMPMILEKSLQARFMIPMAISLGFGVLFTTFVVLLIVPVLYIIIDDIKMLFTGNHY